MRKGAGVIRNMAYIMLSGGLLMASWMDRKECWVYNYVWWWCLPWACLLALSEGWDIRTWIAAAGFAAAGIWSYVRKGGLLCFFGVCIGGMYRGYRNSMAVVSYAAGGDTAYGGAAVSRKCYARRETAGSTAVYSLYYRFFLDGYGVTIFPECNVYLCINSCVFREKVI